MCKSYILQLAKDTELKAQDLITAIHPFFKLLLSCPWFLFINHINQLLSSCKNIIHVSANFMILAFHYKTHLHV